MLNAAFLAFALVFGEYTIASILQYTPFAVFIVARRADRGPAGDLAVAAEPAHHLGLLLLISLLGGKSRSSGKASV